MYPKPQEDAPNFAAWRTETLADFARDAYGRMKQQEEEIEHLRLDLKAALQAYRDLLRR